MFDYDPYYSAYPHYAGQTIDWLPSDTQQLYNMHTKRDNANRRKLKNLNFNSENVKYKFSNKFMTLLMIFFLMLIDIQ